MEAIKIILALFTAYLIGSIPMGLIVVKLTTGKDIRHIQSGRTGGTNTMRAAGFWAGLGVAIFDILKGASGVWIAQWLVPGQPWMEVFGPIAAIIGHNYSAFLYYRDENGKLRTYGGAGGAPSVGGAMGIWFPSIFILFPVGALIVFGIGYASLATISAPLIAAVIFAIRAWVGAPGANWEYVIYGLLAEILLAWSLRPNIKRLLNGTERLVGWRAKKMQSKSKNQNKATESANS